MSARDEHWRLLASYINIAAARAFVAAVATVPLAVATVKLDLGSASQFICCFVLLSLFLQGVAQVILRQVTS